MADERGLKRLDVEKTEIKTAYCISNELREDQMRVANARIKERLVPATSLQDEEIAIVCYGPSLQKTWREVGKFKKIITCSGAHKFLLDRGIIPTWHVDLDPREHKVRMLGQPHPDTEYLMASCCHPRMWDVLEGHKVKLWHIFNGESHKELPLTYPRGEWLLTGGNNVGMRCMVVARVLGYWKQHIFGMDCSFPKDGFHHADVHLNANKKIYETPFNGRMYYCEPVMVQYARQFFHEMEQLPGVKVVLHGDGLLQHMAYARKGEKVKVKKSANIAFSTPVTITQEHIEAHRKLHQQPLYGLGGRKYRKVVTDLAKAMNTTSILDYGCGKGMLGTGLPFPIWEYDPAIPGKDAVPRPADLTVCFNVMECVEPDMLHNVLGDVVRCTNKCAFMVIDTKPSETSLPDGRNLNLIIEPEEWWAKKLSDYFKVGSIMRAGSELHCVLEPRKFEALPS